jgi:hypothetical protein
VLLAAEKPSLSAFLPPPLGEVYRPETKVTGVRGHG